MRVGAETCPWAVLLSVGLLAYVKSLLSTIASTDAATTTTTNNQTKQYVITQFVRKMALLSITTCIS